MSKQKYPKQIYVTAKAQSIDESKYPLGFLNAYEPNKAAFEKKRITQENWAYNRSGMFDMVLEQHGAETWMVGTLIGWQNGLPRTDPDYLNRVQVRKLLDHAPCIWDNDPTYGFKIEKSVNRYSTSNKVWRILDPRGVEFEISTSSLEQIIEDATIIKGGVIDANCAWMSNKNLIVVN